MPSEDKAIQEALSAALQVDARNPPQRSFAANWWGWLQLAGVNLRPILQ